MDRPAAGRGFSPELGPFIKALRKKKRKGTRRVASEMRAAGWPPRVVSREILIYTEHGKRQPCRELCRALAAYYKINEDYMLYLGGYIPTRIVERGLKPAEVVRMYISAERGSFVRMLKESKTWQQYKSALHFGRPTYT